MHYAPGKMTPEIMKVFSLSSTLGFEDQVKFLSMLTSLQDSERKQDLIERTLAGERVWEEKQATSTVENHSR
ncbi:MAG: hypothetical protein GXP58_06745 [Deltaproteobacteria bacterium]|nr:hypothetical protein [Deltaproteobacteria bacterium]